MLAAGMLITWAGYALTSWGYVLVKGWNICLREWVSPIHPYQWNGTPASIPTDQVFPSCGGPANANMARMMQTGGQTRAETGRRGDLQTPDFSV